MSTTENNTENLDVSQSDDLDSFATTLFGGGEEAPSEDATSEEPQDTEETGNDASQETEVDQEEDTELAEEEDEESETEETSEEDEDEGNKPEPKKNRYQERINELTAARREAERKTQELERKLDEVLKKLDPKTEEPAPKPEQAKESAEPQPYDKNEDGTDKYPLGQYDPNFLRDSVKYMLAQDKKEEKAQEQQLRAQTEAQKAQQARQESWNTKLVDAQERYPDFQEKGENMISVFEGIDETYGQYLTETIMEMDAGPDVFYYLANNIDEAQEIVSAGPRKATIALAKLEAQLVGSSKPKTPATKVTKAPSPPPRVKGSSVAKPSVSVDTDDLEAFTRELFRK